MTGQRTLVRTKVSRLLICSWRIYLHSYVFFNFFEQNDLKSRETSLSLMGFFPQNKQQNVTIVTNLTSSNQTKGIPSLGSQGLTGKVPIVTLSRAFSCQPSTLPWWTRRTDPRISITKVLMQVVPQPMTSSIASSIGVPSCTICKQLKGGVRNYHQWGAVQRKKAFSKI